MRRLRSCLVVLPFAFGCSNVLGLGDYKVGEGGSTTGSGGATGGTGGTSSSGGTGGLTGGTGGTAGGTGGFAGGTGGTGGVTGGTGGVTGGTGGTGGSTITECTTGAQQACYHGPPGTEGKGVCKAGTSTCDANGAWGPCLNEVLPSIELCKGDGVDESCDTRSECKGTHDWSKVIVGTDLLYVTGVATDGDDNMVVVGNFRGSIDFGSGASQAANMDAFVVKLSPEGVILWSRLYGGAGDQSANGVAMGPAGNIHVVGTYAIGVQVGAAQLPSQGGNDLFVFELDKDGNPGWLQGFGGAQDDRGLAIATNSAGETFVTGGYLGTFSIAGVPLPTAIPGENVIVVKLDPLGMPSWGKGFGDGSSQLGTAIAVDTQSGAVWVGANATGDLNFGCGATVDAGGGDIVIAKLDAITAACLQAKRFGDAAQQLVSNVVAFPGGGIIVGAQVRGNTNFGGLPTTGDSFADVAILKMGPQAGVNWVKRFGAQGSNQFQQGLAVDALSNIIVSGSFATSIDFTGGQGATLTAVQSYDRYVAKLDPIGTHIWSQGFVNSVGGYTFVATDHLGRVDIAGNVTGQTDLGGGNIGVAGSPLSFLVGQLAP